MGPQKGNTHFNPSAKAVASGSYNLVNEPQIDHSQDSDMAHAFLRKCTMSMVDRLHLELCCRNTLPQTLLSKGVISVSLYTGVVCNMFRKPFRMRTKQSLTSALQTRKSEAFADRQGGDV